MQNQMQLISATLLQWEAGPTFCARAYGAQNWDPNHPKPVTSWVRHTGVLRGRCTPWMKNRMAECHYLSTIVPFEVTVAERESEGRERERRRSKDVAEFPRRKSTEFGAQRPQMKSALEFGFATFRLCGLVGITWGKNGWECTLQMLEHIIEVRAPGQATLWQKAAPGSAGDRGSQSCRVQTPNMMGNISMSVSLSLSLSASI